ncbi:tRNA A37 threonylcarbamoyladenosine synthetase subunit TsaC/SUA5/YrdC [Halanaeroarchaeum sp. HSR-CO]|uniref:L-threonylcarbamoyladenylate synthase n=1 Tax=Halanaeroarchaeum sp. HSR-CO TaxID=2866382 RepID=UPI00217F1784|nr:L-threonylcarbamoyladenylate synthase [Halanaeroarchaeum sp. HSR-CO]UWG46464.1 tRNA A37 threonylcarbamoyladenosine synthetase subunit TsaC/SUA5/YrdC [Halanaeroarchaeum sp. HSR-CO]
MHDVEQAADAIRSGRLVVYPTETVYGLGADALDEAAIERVFAAKRRVREEPISLAVPTVDRAFEYVDATDRESTFMREFLPGPVTVVVAKRAAVPDVLTGGRQRVGVRVPDHDLARSLLHAAAPITATSANVSGNPSVTAPDDLDPAIRSAAAVVLDGGETAGTASTVVDVSADEVLREGRDADAVRAWLTDHR